MNLAASCQLPASSYEMTLVRFEDR